MSEHKRLGPWWSAQDDERFDELLAAGLVDPGERGDPYCFFRAAHRQHYREQDALAKLARMPPAGSA
jgi:hypothetical protein